MRPCQSGGLHGEPWRAKDKLPPQILARAHLHPAGRPFLPPRGSAGLRRCGAAIFWPHAALQPHPPSGVSPAELQSPEALAASESCGVRAWKGSTSVSPGQAPETPNQLRLERDNVPGSQRPQGSLRLPPPLPPAWACWGTATREAVSGRGHLQESGAGSQSARTRDP